MRLTAIHNGQKWIISISGRPEWLHDAIDLATGPTMKLKFDWFMVKTLLKGREGKV